MTKVKYKEIFKLKVMLDSGNIPYEFYDNSLIDYQEHEIKYPSYQIIVYYPNEEEQIRLISVIEGFGSYGEKEDLLEIMGCLTNEERECDEVKGCLTAEDVYNRIINNYK